MVLWCLFFRLWLAASVLEEYLDFNYVWAWHAWVGVFNSVRGWEGLIRVQIVFIHSVEACILLAVLWLVFYLQFSASFIATV